MLLARLEGQSDDAIAQQITTRVDDADLVHQARDRTVDVARDGVEENDAATMAIDETSIQQIDTRVVMTRPHANDLEVMEDGLRALHAGTIEPSDLDGAADDLLAGLRVENSHDDALALRDVLHEIAADLEWDDDSEELDCGDASLEGADRGDADTTTTAPAPNPDPATISSVRAVPDADSGVVLRRSPVFLEKKDKRF